MKNKFERVLMTQEEYRKSERNKRLLHTVVVGTLFTAAFASAIAAAYMAWFR